MSRVKRSHKAYVRFAVALATVACLLLHSGDGWSLSQPNGIVIPTGNSLQTLFNSRGEGIDALADANIVPETFIPSCSLTFEVVQRDSSYNDSFGWYNVTGVAPTLDELHEVLSCTDLVGTIRTVDIANHPAYLGGEVGFYEATGPCGSLQNHYHIFYSQRQYNIDGSGSDAYIHLLIYNSTVVPRAFYFAWEDLLSGGDNDFNDMTTFVTGITCSGGGGPCDTGLLGVCADGTMQCQSGELVCVASNQPSDEVCDGLDNNCDGLIDNEAECPGIEVCDRGVCVPPCSDTEFPCSGGSVCDDGFCVEPACVDVDCPPGLRCEGGECVEPCTGAVCPHGQVCRLGVCLDPCTSLSCDDPQICVDGVCVDRCECTGCDPNETCLTNGVCVPTPCVDNTCASHEYCAPDGTCVDRCLNAVCPRGQVCELGTCVEAPPQPDAGVPDGGDAGFEGDGGPDANGSNGANSQGGCNCRAGIEPIAGGYGVTSLFLLSLLFVLLRRRRT